MAFHILVLLSMISVFEVALGDEPIIVPVEAQMLGGSRSVSPDSRVIQDAAKKAVQHFNAGSKEKKLFKLLKVSSAQSQVTNMVSYDITATIVETKCLKSAGQDVDLDKCATDKKQLQCKFHVEESDKKFTVLSTSCN